MFLLLDMLIIICVAKIAVVKSQMKSQIQTTCSKSLGTDLAKQLADPKFTDWTLVCEGEEEIASPCR